MPAGLKSVRIRFVIALLGNALRALASFSAGILVARGLGVQEFGVFTFIVGTFTSLRPLLDLGVSTAFYTFISRGGYIRPYLRFYSIWLAMQFVLMVALIGLLLPGQAYHAVWLGQPRGLVLLGFVATFFQLQVWSTLAQIGESQRETLVVQSANVLIALLHLGVVTALLAGHLLTVRLLMGVLLVEYLTAGVLAGLVLRRRYTPVPVSFSAAPSQAGVRREFVRYCYPLILSAAAGAAFEFGDRWMLQRFGGAINQGLYQAAYQFSAISLLATTSIMQVFWKELSDAHSNGNRDRLFRLYSRVSKGVVFIGALLTGLLAPWSTEIVLLLLGADYDGAGNILALLFIYPVFQALGQVTATLAFATQETSVYGKTTIAFTVISLGATYLLLAPNTAAIPGLALGAYGLAIKNIIIPLLSVSVLTYLLAKKLQFNYRWLDQTQALFICLLLGYGAKYSLDAAFGHVSPTFASRLASLVLASLTYATLHLALLLKAPIVYGFSKGELLEYWRVVFGGK